MKAWILCLSGACAFAAAAAAPITSPPTFTRETIGRIPTAELARELLRPEIANRVMEKQVSADRWFSEWPLRGVGFYTRPEPLGDQLCRRERHHVSMEPVDPTAGRGQPNAPVSVGGTNKFIEIALAPNCALATGARFAQVAPHQEQGAIEILLWLNRARADVRRNGLGSFDIACRTELPDDPCPTNLRQVVAGLDLESIAGIHAPSENNPWGWRVEVNPVGSYWEVVVSEQRAGRRLLIVGRKVPAPF